MNESDVSHLVYILIKSYLPWITNRKASIPTAVPATLTLHSVTEQSEGPIDTVTSKPKIL